jgi:outer membrane receptor protein involved in Fe transport
LFGNNLSSRATLVYSIDEKNSIKLIAGQSYRAPSLFELYFETPDNQVFGNINLKPETSNSIEIAYLRAIDNFFVQALVYFSSYNNKAYRVRRFPNHPTNYSVIYINGNEFTAKGVELEFRYSRANLLDAFLNYSYSTGNSGDEVNNSGHYNFKYIPAHTISFGFAKDFSDVTLSLLSNYRSKSNSLLGEIKPSITFDFNISYNQKFLNGNLRHNLSAKNLFNETVMFPEYNGRNIKEVPSGYGRRIYYELQYSL